MKVCARCNHANDDSANYCSSCGAPLASGDADTTQTLRAVDASDDTDDLAQHLAGLTEGVALLVVRQGPATGSSFRLDTDRTTLGRHPDSNIFLDDITVSRRHVVIERRGTVFVARDAGSLNGMYVNRRRMEEALLHHGDELQVGRYRLTFVQAGARP